jgi:hypothetical protein
MTKLPVLAYLICAAAAFAGSWSDSLVAAIQKGNHSKEHQLLDLKAGQCEAVTGLKSVALALQSYSEAGRAGSGPLRVWNSRMFEWAMRPHFRDACYSEFARNALDSTAPESFRSAVLNVMLSNAGKLKTTPPAALHTAMRSILSSGTSSTSLKAFVLRHSGPLSTSTYADFSPYLTSEDSTLKESAFDGLIQNINRNGLSGKKEENREIFNAFKGLVSQPITLGQVRVIATIREDYSRDYLLTKCAGDAKKIAAIFLRDGKVAHTGLIAEAATRIRMDANPSALQKAVAQGMKDPEWNIDRLLSGSSNDLKDGLTLLRAFPKLAADHAAIIQQKSQSPDPETKSAAQNLLPYLSVATSN